MNAVTKLVFLASLVLLPLACWHADDLDPTLVVHPLLAADPVQTETGRTPFEVRVAGTRYTIEPRYRYELRGLVVSLRHHDGDRMLHELWNDHLNVADLCVVWGGNANVADLARFDFESGQFTCFFHTRDSAAWRRFDVTRISNNHLLANDPALREAIAGVRIGDQIRLSGYLARYGNDSGFSRGTSTTRTDTGDGACETIYVTDFAVLDTMETAWRSLVDVSWLSLIGSALFWLVAVMRGWM